MSLDVDDMVANPFDHKAGHSGDTLVDDGAADGVSLMTMRDVESIAPAEGVAVGASGLSPQPPTRRGQRWGISYRGISRLTAALDAVIIVATATVSALAYNLFVSGDTGEIVRTAVISVFVATFFLIVTNLRRLYDPTELLIWNNQLQNVLVTWGGAFIFLGGMVFSLGMSKEASRGAILWFAISGGVGLLTHRLFWRAYIAHALAAGSLIGRNTVVICLESRTAATSTFTTNLAHHGYRIVREIVIRTVSPTGIDDCLEKAIAFIRSSDVEDIYVISKPDRMGTIGEVMERLRVLPIPVALVPDAVTAELVKHSWHQIGHSVAIELQRPPLSAYERAFKRAMDILVASFGLLALAPLMVLVAIAIKIDSPGPVLFRQTRRGFNGKRFKIFKFRSMTVLEDGATITQARPTDKRVTRVGAVIRKTSIDEIPQLLNVLFGHMSMVGPRPHAVAHDDYFQQQIENYAFRHHVKPGITGWAQVNGHRGETETVDKMKRRVEYDRWYINNWSFGLDIMIMARTLGEVVRGANAY